MIDKQTAEQTKGPMGHLICLSACCQPSRQWCQGQKFTHALFMWIPLLEHKFGIRVSSHSDILVGERSSRSSKLHQQCRSDSQAWGWGGVPGLDQAQQVGPPPHTAHCSSSSCQLSQPGLQCLPSCFQPAHQSCISFYCSPSCATYI